MTRLDEIIEDMRYVFDCLMTMKYIYDTGHDCNTCKATCEHRQLGRQVTYNCPLWEGDSDEQQ